jgi:hypothetical protein
MAMTNSRAVFAIISQAQGMTGDDESSRELPSRLRRVDVHVFRRKAVVCAPFLV